MRNTVPGNRTSYSAILRCRVVLLEYNFQDFSQIFVHPSKKVSLSKLKMIPGRRLKVDLPRLVHSLEPKEILLVPARLSHRNGLVRGAVLEMAPVLAFVRKNHSIKQSFYHNIFVDCYKVSFVCRVDSGAVLIVPQGQLRVCQVVRCVRLARIAKVVCLEENALHKRVEGKVAAELGDTTAEGTL